MAVLAVALTALPARAAPKCFGERATIVSGETEVLGTARDDVIVLTGVRQSSAYGLGGDDLICGNGATNVLSGGPGHDKLRGRGQTDYHYGGLGNDRLVGDAGDRAVDVGIYIGATGPVTVDWRTHTVKGEGIDRFSGLKQIFGSDFDDTMIGDDGSNYIYGRGGDDDITGGEGFDVIEPGLGNDHAVGGGGTDPDDIDVIAYRDVVAETGVDVDLEAGTSTGDGVDTFTGFEAVQGSSFDDALQGSPGRDFMVGGPGDDDFDGGDGFDYVVYWLAAGPVDADLGTGRSVGAVIDFGTGDIGEGTDTFSGIEGLMGSAFDDRLVGDDGDNYLEGFTGDDQLVAGAGDDWLDGYLGADTFDGGEGNDICLDGEDLTSCEDLATPEDHPLYGEASTAEGFRRNFRRNF